MTLVEHLRELRNRLVKSRSRSRSAPSWRGSSTTRSSTSSSTRTSSCARTGADSSPNCQLLATDPLEGFSVRIKIATYGGIGLAMPVILWQLWRFVSPGLYAHEKRYALPFVCRALALFVMGAASRSGPCPRR